MTYASLRLVGVEHQLWADFLIKLLRGEEAKGDSSFLESGTLFVGLLGCLGDIYSMDEIEKPYAG